MKLSEYLKLNGMTQTEFGLLLDPPMTQMHISHVVTGRSRISLARAVEIMELTKGEVPVTAWLDAEPQAKEADRLPPVECGAIDPRHAIRRDEGAEPPHIMLEHRTTTGRRGDDHNKEAA